MADKVHEVSSIVQQSFKSGGTRSLDWRIQQLKALGRMIEECDEQIINTITLDLGKSGFETETCESFRLKAKCYCSSDLQIHCKENDGHQPSAANLKAAAKQSWRKNDYTIVLLTCPAVLPRFTAAAAWGLPLRVRRILGQCLLLFTGWMEEPKNKLDAAALIAELRCVFKEGKTRLGMDWRIKQLNGMVDLIQKHEDEITAAVSLDMGKPSYECFTGEIFPVKSACKNAVKNLKSWTAAVKATPLLATLPASAAMKPEPYGVVLIISAWNFPFLLSMDPLVGAVAAGNAVVVKPSEIAPATSALLAKLLPLYLDKSAIRVVEGGVEETTALLAQKWDKIFYTGSARVGRIVMGAAAKHLTPVTLELGGKCPVIVDPTINFEVAARRIAVGKWGNNNGQACISPDYVLVQSSCVTKLIDAMKKTLKDFYGDNPADSPDLSRVVNKSHFNRLVGLLDEPKVSEKIIYGGEKDAKKLYISPTLLLDVPMESKIMSEEIFGPLLPIFSVDSIDQAIDIVNSRSKPLALYVFTKTDEVKEKVITETSAGGMVVNDCCLHFLTTSLPFGGVGESGMGSYHGKFSFDNFSHMKAVLYRPFWADVMARYPPYTAQKKSIIRCLLEADFLGVVMSFLGLRS